MVVGDFNEDGKLDLAVSNQFDNTVTILLGVGNGTFSPQTPIPAGASGFPLGLITGDFNNDGHLDLGAVNASTVGLLLGNGTGTFTLHETASTGTGNLSTGAVGDFNGDDKLDVVVSDSLSGQAFLFLGAGNGTFASAITLPTTTGTFGVTTGDFNGDGGLDLAITNSNGGDVLIYLQERPPSLSPLSLSFGNQHQATASASQVVTLTNMSGSPLSISSITFGGVNGTDFSKTTTCGVTLANLNTCTISVTFTAGGVGARTGTLVVSDNATNTPQTVALSGTGINSSPTIAKSFGAASIALNGSTSLSFTISNPVANAISLTGVSFTDPFPSGLVVATPNGLSGTCGGGIITAAAASGSVSLSGGTLAVNSSCTFRVNVKGVTAGAQGNTTNPVSATESGAGVASSTATVTVVGPPVIIKSCGSGSVPLNGSTSLTFTASNPNVSSSLSSVGFTDALPVGLVVSTPNGLTGSCGGGSITALAGSSSVNLSGAALASSASCSFSINVTGTTAGAKNNTTGAVTSTEGGTGGTASASLAVEAPPTIGKAFGAASIALNGTTSLTFTITNPAANAAALTGVAFTDTFPVGLIVATPTA